MRTPLTVALTLALAAIFMLALPVSAEKIKIEKLDDLPRHTYKIELKAVELIENQEALLDLAHQIQVDMLDDLEKYEIPDKTTLKGYYQFLGIVAIMDQHFDDYRKYFQLALDLEEKEASRLTMGLFTRSLITALESGEADLTPIIKKEYAARVNELPYEIVGDELKSSKARAEMMTANLIIGIAASRMQPVLDENEGIVSKEIAQQLVSFGYALKSNLPYSNIIIEVLSAYLDANAVDKPNIWTEREVILESGKDHKPVVVCIWDSGSDVDVFKDILWTNEKEIAGNSIDDDSNGFIDDVNGIAYTLFSDKTPELLYPIGGNQEDRPRLQKQMKGLSDLQANIDSEESSAIKKTLGSLKPEEVQGFIEDIGKYGNLCHGTHVAGIALRGNPYAQLLTSRITFDYRMIGEVPTLEQARKDSAATIETIQYYKDHGVRVVNMSWGGSLAGIESALEEHNVGGTPEERKALAREMFEIGKAALIEAFTNTPEILYVTSAGNANNDVSFEEFLPSGLDLPNILSVGAVDQAGDETSFTSFGKVDVYANGFNVLSYVPGGDKLELSGTSQASPQITNLVAKLLTVNPELTVTQLRQLIIDGADEKTAGKRTVLLMNPAKTFELLSKM